jgi:hypothetical protein
MVGITSHTGSEDTSDLEDIDTSSEMSNDSSDKTSSSSEVSNDTFSGASDGSSGSARAVPESLHTNGQTQSAPPARSSQMEVEAHKGPVNPFLNAWPNMSKRPPNWHSGMTDSESEGSSSSSDSDSDSEHEEVKKAPKTSVGEEFNASSSTFRIESR